MSRRKRHFTTVSRPSIETSQTQRQILQQLKRKERDFSVAKSVNESPDRKEQIKQAERRGHHLSQVSIFAGNYEPEFVDAIDVEQGETDNCFSIEELTQIVRSDPTAVKSLIRHKEKGIYEVTIYVNAQPNAKPGEGTRIPLTMLVDDTLPNSYHGVQTFNQLGEVSGEGGDLAVMLIEKAYAMYKGGANVSTWKHPGEAMAALSGNRSDIYYTNAFNEKQVIHLINQALVKELLVTASTGAMSENEQEQAQKVNPGIQEKHNYRVKEVNLSSLTIYLQHPQTSRFDISGLPISEFRKYFPKFQFSR
jgi:hypothetical protein